jgi:hypothetical protein
VAVRAEDDAGIRAFLRSEAASGFRPRPQPTPAPLASITPRPFVSIAPRHHFLRSSPAPKARYVRLPRVEKAPEPPIRKTAEKRPSGPVDHVAALMKDPTLRRGDIVMMPDGPKVFTGGSEAPHRPRDFEDARQSGALSASARKAVLAILEPASASKSQKRLAAHRPKPQPEKLAAPAPAGEPSQATIASIRVVYPAGR